MTALQLAERKLSRRTLIEFGLATGGIILLERMAPWSVTPAAAAPGTDRLVVNERLDANQYLVSPNGQYVFRMQEDGNAVIVAPGNVPVWSTGTRGAAFFVNQGDGNLVVYTTATPHVALWNSGTVGNGPSTLIMQNDGNLVLYRDSGGHTWASNTAASSTADLARQILGNSRITLATIHPSGVRDNANARQNIVDTANGQLAARSSYGTAPGGRVALDGRMLRGILALADTYTFRVSEIAGASHSRNSLHYAGVAVDVDLINGRAVAAGDLAKAFMQRGRGLEAIEVLGPGNPGHSSHIHLGWPRR